MKLAPSLVATAGLLAGLVGCPGPGHAPRGATPVAADAASSANRPRLVVLLVIDQWPEWAFEAKRAAFHEGFARLLAEGTWHVGLHPSVATLTAPGHALLGSGEPPARSGILTNHWWHRDLGRALMSVEGVDGKPTAAWLRVPGLGDAVAAAGTGAKAVAVSLKDRAAILPLGHHGDAIWYDPHTTSWTSLRPLPWLAAYGHAHPIAAHLHDVWTPLDPARLATLAGVPDAQPGEFGEKGMGPTFPHAFGAAKDPAATVFASPLGNEVVLDAATAAIEHEHLGADATPDLLVVSLSAHDYVGHGWGQESWEMWDLELRLDRQLGRFLGELDRLVGARRWAMIVTSDHGASPLPDRLGGGRLTHHQVEAAANHAASAVLGAGTWIDSAHWPTIYFSAAFLARPARERASAEEHVMNALRSFPEIERVGRVADLAGHCETRTGDDRALCLAFDRERSGDLFYLPAKGYIVHSELEPQATAHGSLHGYDRRVPVLLLPAGRTPHLPATAPEAGTIPMETIASRLATWLGVAAPATLAPATR